MPLVFILFTFLAFPPHLLSSAQIHHSRRILHQPLFPLDSSPPIAQPPFPSPEPQPQPPPQQQPKYPFSSQSPPDKPFFPVYPSPPPPPPSTGTLATFPANISSLILPQSSSSKPVSRKLLAIAVTVSLLSVALIAALAAFLLFQRRHRNFIDKDATRSDSLRLFPPDATASDGGQRPPRSVSNTSTEFLYLGTLASSRGTENDSHASNFSSNVASALSSYQKLGSPELHPLPPLPRQTSRPNCRNAEVASYGDGDDEDEEEFFSPRGSSGGKGSPTGIGSNSRREFRNVDAENLGSRSSNSRTVSYPSSHSGSPTHSVSSSPSIPLNISPRSLRSKSPDSVVDFPSQSRPLPVIPPPSIAQSPPKSRRWSPSPPTSSPETNSGKTHNSPGRISDIAGINRRPSTKEKSALGQYVAVKLPPPPPPPPPPRFWETPAVPRLDREQISGPPVLIAPSRPVVFQNPAPVSSAEQAQSMAAVERNEDIPKPKLKPLHWDKVRASSDRAMVWDQLKSSSFQ